MAFFEQVVEGQSILETVVRQMEDRGFEYRPDPKVSKFHDAKFSVFLQMLQDQLKYREMMKEAF
jgi:hypothetical protein